MSLAKHIFGVGAWTGVSRILGFVRDMLIGQYLGAGRLSDIFLTAFRLPNLFRDLLGEGAMSSVFVPMFSREKRDPNFASNVFSWLMLVLLLITIAVEIFMPFIIWGLAPGFDPEKMAMTVYVSRIIFGYVVLVCIVGFMSAILNAFSDFIYAAITPVFFNIALIFGVMTFKTDLPWLAVVTLIAGAIQIFILWTRLRHRNFGLRLIIPKMNPLIKNMGRRMTWGFVGSGFYQLNVIVGVLLASYESGAVSYLYYSDRLVQLPFAIVALAAGTVILTKISDALSAKKMDAVYRYQGAALSQSLMLILPCMVGLMVLGEPIVRALFERGAWAPDATGAVALAILIQALSLPAMTTSQIYLKTLYASGDAKTPVKISAISLFFGVLLMFALVGEIGYLCVPTATVISGLVRNRWLYGTCRRRGLYKPDAKTYMANGVFLILSVAMGAGLYFARPFITGFATLGLAIMVSAIIYLPIAVVCDKIIRNSRGRKL